jgi:hypothetical protein
MSVSRGDMGRYIDIDMQVAIDIDFQELRQIHDQMMHCNVYTYIFIRFVSRACPSCLAVCKYVSIQADTYIHMQVDT